MTVPMSRLALLAVLLVGAGPAAALQDESQTYHQRNALAGHDAFAMQIVGLGDGSVAQMLGIRGDEMLAAMEGRARAAGVVVTDLADDGARAMLEIKIILAYNEELRLAIWSTEAAVKQAFIDAEGHFVYAATWGSGGYVGAAILARAREEIELSVTNQVDKFLADFQAVRRGKP